MERNVARLYKEAKKAGIDAMGGKRAFWIMGSTIRKAFITQAVFNLLALQDDSIPDAKVRALLDGMWDAINEDRELIEDYPS